MKLYDLESRRFHDGRIGDIRMSKEFRDDVEKDSAIMGAINDVLEVIYKKEMDGVVDWFCHSNEFKDLQGFESEIPRYVLNITKSATEEDGEVNPDTLSTNERIAENHKNVIFSFKASLHPHPETMTNTRTGKI